MTHLPLSAYSGQSVARLQHGLLPHKFIKNNKGYALKAESRVNAFSDSIWILSVFYLVTHSDDMGYYVMSFQRTPATETQFAAASKQNQQD